MNLMLSSCRFPQRLEDQHLYSEEDVSESSDVPSRIREIVTKSISPPDRSKMARESSLLEENRMLQSELSRVEDLLADTRAERDEIGSRYSALSEKVSQFVFKFYNITRKC